MYSFSLSVCVIINLFLILIHPLEQGCANFLYGGPHWKKMLQPRVAHSHYKLLKNIQCINNHVIILKTIFVFHT